MEDTLGLAALVSLTDHDSIQAPALLRLATETEEMPLSLEWSVAFEGAMFHLGIHNLPADKSLEIAAKLAKYTQNPSEHSATNLLAMLHELPEVLIVFNHPFWDLNGLGERQHGQRLQDFLERNNPFLHAFELNGMRTWQENKKVGPLAESWQQPIISGGDRHALEPSAVVNLTNAQSLSEFIQEIRVDQRSHVLFMPQYSDPMCVRIAHSVLDIIRYYPEHPEDSRRWDDRVFHPDKAGTVDQPLSAFWKAPPAFIERIFSVFRLAENATVQWAAKCVYANEIDFRTLSESPSEAIP